MGRELPVGGEAEVVAEVVGAASDFAKLGSKGVSSSNVVKDNADLRGQIAFLKHRLDARGGRDFPPCWADETGKVQFLFALEARSDSITIVPGWPESREESAICKIKVGTLDVNTFWHDDSKMWRPVPFAYYLSSFRPG